VAAVIEHDRPGDVDVAGVEDAVDRVGAADGGLHRVEVETHLLGTCFGGKQRAGVDDRADRRVLEVHDGGHAFADGCGGVVLAEHLGVVGALVLQGDVHLVLAVVERLGDLLKRLGGLSTQGVPHDDVGDAGGLVQLAHRAVGHVVGGGGARQHGDAHQPGPQPAGAFGARSSIRSP